MLGAVDPQIGRRTWRTLEPIHGAIYFAADPREEYRSLGVADRMAGYFASRSAPMGVVTPGVVIATFFNFDPSLVVRSMDGVWDVATPMTMLAARVRGADAMLRRLGGALIDDGATAEAAALARRAALVACERPEGRPLFAGHADLPWPDEPHLVLWHAQTLLREFRGDGHIVALVDEGLDGCEALVSHGAAGEVPADTLRRSRQRTDDDWNGAVERLKARGWLDADGDPTELGRERRAVIEARTDELAIAPYRSLGEDGCARLRELARPLSAAMMAAFA
jgi:hypothetical protein